MKSAGFLTTLTLLFHLLNIHGQQNGLPNNQNLEANSIIPQHPTSNAANCIQRLLNRDEISSAPQNDGNQQQMQMQLSLVPSLLIPRQKDPPTDQRQPLQQPLGLQQPLTQQMPTFQENINLLQPPFEQQPNNQNQSPPNIQPLIFQPLNIHPNFQSVIPHSTNQVLTSQESLQHINSQPNLHGISSQQNIQQLNSQPNLQANSQINHQASNLQPNVPAITTNIPQPSYQPIGSQFSLQQLSPQSNIQQLNLPSNVQLGQLTNTKVSAGNINWLPQQNSIPIVADINHYPPRAPDNRDQSSIIYSAASQQSPTPPSFSPTNSNNPPISLIPSYSIKPVDQSIVAKYNYVKPSSDSQPAIVEPVAFNSVSALQPVLKITSPSVQNTNTQAYYYNQQLPDSKRNVYFNQNVYSQQPQMAVLATMQNQPAAALLPSQSVLSSFPISILQSPSISPQYLISSGYPSTAVLTPVHTGQKSISANLKSFLPLIINLLKEKLKSNECGCSCDCKNRTREIEPEVLSGYSNQKHYGSDSEHTLSVLNMAADETEGAECFRERKNCSKDEGDDPDVSEETEEEDYSDEEEDVDDDED